MSDSPKLLRTTQGTIWVVHWVTQDFFVSCSIGACMINVSEWHKFAIAIITLVFPEPGDCWGTLDSKAASVDRSVTCPTTAVTNLAFPIRLLSSAFITCQNYILASMFVGRVCLSVCLYGNFTKSQKRLNQSSPNLVISKHQSMIPASSLDKNVGQITRSRGLKLGQILKLP